MTLISNPTNMLTTTTIPSIGSVYYSVSGTGKFPKKTFTILDSTYEHVGHIDDHLVVAISTLNILKKPFWNELKKNGVQFPLEMEQFIEKRITILERDKKIDDIIN